MFQADLTDFLTVWLATIKSFLNPSDYKKIIHDNLYLI